MSWSTSVRLVPSNMFKPRVIFWLIVTRGYYIVDPIHICLYHIVSSVPWSRVVICSVRANLLVLLCVMFSCVFVTLCLCHFPIWCPGSGVLLDCIDSWSFPSCLLWGLVLKRTGSMRWFFWIDHIYINCWFPVVSNGKTGKQYCRIFLTLKVKGSDLC